MIKISDTYKDQFVLRFDDVDTVPLCYFLGKSHRIFVEQCKRLGIDLVPSPMTIVRKYGKSFQNSNCKICNRDTIIYLMAHDPTYRVKLAKILKSKDLSQISVREVLSNDIL